MRRLDALEFDEAQGLKIEFWGGEPLVYIKTLRPLVEGDQRAFPGMANEAAFTPSSRTAR